MNNLLTGPANHPANGPLPVPRIERVIEALQRSLEYQNGGDMAYVIADAIKGLEELLVSREAVPVGYFYADIPGDWYQISDGDIVPSHRRIPLYASPQSSPVVKLPNEFISSEGVVVQVEKVMAVLAVHGIQYERRGNACRAAMLQDGNSPVTPDGWIPVSERIPEREVDVQVYCSDKKEQMVGYMERNEKDGWFRFASLPNGGGVYCKPTHWQPLPSAPKELK